MLAQRDTFVALFNNPSVEGMYALSPQEFQQFVEYVFQRAGYQVRRVRPHLLRGVHLELRVRGTPRIFGGVECTRVAPGQPVTASVVRAVRGARAIDHANAKPFIVTTGDFDSAAHQVANSGKRPVYLINGAQLARYITYVQGSRHDDDNTITALSPEFFAEQLLARTPGGAKILTIANNKGGVGKTTTAYYLGSELARAGQRVLLIDLDAQANLTEWCFNGLAADRGDEIERPLNITTYFSVHRPLHELLTSAGSERLSLIPSDPYLRLRDLGGNGRPDIESQFVRDVQCLGEQSISSLGGAPDWIIIDTPPAMSVFTRAGLAAAHYVLAPVRPRNASLTGTENMYITLRTMNALTDNRTVFLGTVITHWDDLVISRRFETISLPRALPGLGGQAFTTKIPIDNRLETVQPGANTNGARAYTELAEEVVRHVNAREQTAIEVGD